MRADVLPSQKAMKEVAEYLSNADHDQGGEVDVCSLWC